MDDLYYNDSRPRRGIALIICNENFRSRDPNIPAPGRRKGAYLDKRNLQNTFAELDFDVRCFMDVTASEILTNASKVAKSNLDLYDCLVVAISTHATTTTVPCRTDHGIEGVDLEDELDLLRGTDAPFAVEVLTTMFNEANCPGLAGKPKLFFFQGCRGEQLAETVTVTLPRVESRTDGSGASVDAAADPPMEAAGGSGEGMRESDMTDALVYKPAHSDLEAPGTFLFSTVVESIEPMDTEPMSRLSPGNATPNNSTPRSPPTSHAEESRRVDPSPTQAPPPREKIVSKKVVISRDFLTMWSCPPGYYAFHSPRGSPFIIHLCDVLRNKYKTDDLLTMLTEVNRKVATQFESKIRDPVLDKRHIVPCVEHMLHKKVRFRVKNPRDNGRARNHEGI